MIDQLSVTFDQDARANEAKQAQQLLVDDVADIYLLYPSATVVSTTKVKNVPVHPIDYYLLTKDSTIAVSYTHLDVYKRQKYHIVFAPKYRRQIIYGRIKADVGKILRDLCKRKNVEIIEAECCPDHIHMLVTIPPHLSVSSFMGYLKSKSSLMIFDKHANLKYKYGNRHFWCRGYYVDTVGRYEGAIKEYIRNQLQEDIAQDTLNFKEYTDPFTGEPVK